MTSELPEMRASDSERERVAEQLRDAVAEGRIDMEEFDTRLEAAFKARTHGELQPLIQDLPAAGTTTDLAPSTSGSSAVGDRWGSRIGRSPAHSKTSKGGFAFWSGFSRKGTWTVGPSFTGAVFQGGGDIDLREAHFEQRDVVIRCFALMGGIDIVVPPDMDVTVRGFGVMGDFGEESDVTDVTPGSPRVIITGFALMGAVGVQRKMRAADKRRLKEERKRAQLEKDRFRKELD
ncbi:DUF1707 domain-containing protein [Streptomyces sp. NBC_01511]|uniref:DUF1707 SHOCT-like domain-containing protein n=1 Tax=Streptomyces sp. NBC_01511 TaxID=2903889 RepID=UPI003863B35E